MHASVSLLLLSLRSRTGAHNYASRAQRDGDTGNARDDPLTDRLDRHAVLFIYAHVWRIPVRWSPSFYRSIDSVLLELWYHPPAAFDRINYSIARRTPVMEEISFA